MVKNNDVIQTIYGAIDEVNKHRAKGRRLKKAVNTRLYDKSGDLDSLELVSLIVAVEQRIERRFGVALTLASDRAFARKSSPFRSVSALSRFVGTLLKDRSGKR